MVLFLSFKSFAILFCVITGTHFSLNWEELWKRKLMLTQHGHTGVISRRMKCSLLEGSTHIFPNGEEGITGKNATVVQAESFFITVLGLSSLDVNICTVGFATVAAINIFLKQPLCLSIPPNSTDLSKSITLTLLLWLAKWSHITSQKTFFEIHQETVISALLLVTEVVSSLDFQALNSFGHEPTSFQTENVAKKKQKTCHVGKNSPKECQEESLCLKRLSPKIVPQVYRSALESY